MTDGQSWCKAESGVHNQIFVTDSCSLTVAQSENQSYITPNDQLASLSWYQSCIRDLWVCSLTAIQSQSQKLCYDEPVCLGVKLLSEAQNQTFVTVIQLWGKVSDRRMGLLFTIAAVPCQHSHSQVQVVQDSMSNIQDSRNLEGQAPVLKFPRNKVAQLYPPFLAHRATVEVFKHVFMRVTGCNC
jgi:hypothetical protein